MEFEWDEQKRATNLRKHGLDFEDVIEMFEEPWLRRRSDRDGEQRWKAIGLLRGIEVTVIYTMRGNVRRIISARKAAKHELETYHQAFSGGPKDG